MTTKTIQAIRRLPDETITIDGVDYPKIAATEIPAKCFVTRAGENMTAVFSPDRTEFMGLLPVSLEALVETFEGVEE